MAKRDKVIVMILTNAFAPDVRVYKEAKYLRNKGFTVTILCWDREINSNYKSEELYDGIQIVRFNIPSKAGSGYKQIFAFIKYAKMCKSYLRKNHADYIHSNDIDGAMVGYFARLKNTPIVFDMHEFYERGSDTRKKMWRKMTIFLLKKSIAGLYENNAYLKEEYSAIHDRLYPLKNYPDHDTIIALPKTPSSKLRISYNGVVRGQITEFTALFEAVKDMNDVVVEINGGGIDYPKLKEMEKDYSNVHINGWYDGITESTRIYSESDILFCGYDASNPNYQGDAEVVKFYEAIVTGTPMIMTKGIGMADKVLSNGFGIVCDTRDPFDIRKAIIEFKDNHSFLEKCASNELRMSEKYVWNNAVKVLDQIYK